MLTAAVARFLDDLGHGTYDVAGATIHLEELPAQPPNAVSVAFKTGPVDNTADGYARNSIAIVVRQSNTTGRARSGYDKALAIRDDLNGLKHQVLAAGTDDETRLIWMLSDDGGPTNLGDDSNGTPRWSLRFTALIAHDTAHTTL
jgi:hypothetical protein